MSVELAEFHEIYFAECLENIDLLQIAVAQYSGGNPDDEALTRAYRAAHSIKGASAIFGFHPAADSARAIEIMLEQIRGEKRVLSAELCELLVQAIERLHKKLDTARLEQALDMSRIEVQREILRREQDVYAPANSMPARENATDAGVKKQA